MTWKGMRGESGGGARPKKKDDGAEVERDGEYAERVPKSKTASFWPPLKGEEDEEKEDDIRREGAEGVGRGQRTRAREITPCVVPATKRPAGRVKGRV